MEPFNAKDKIAEGLVRSPLRDLSNQTLPSVPDSSLSGVDKEKSAVGFVDSDVKLNGSATATPRSVSPACSTPTHSNVGDTTTDEFESAEEGTPRKLSVSALAERLDQVHLSTPTESADLNKPFVFPYSPVEDELLLDDGRETPLVFSDTTDKFDNSPIKPETSSDEVEQSNLKADPAKRAIDLQDPSSELKVSPDSSANELDETLLFQPKTDAAGPPHQETSQELTTVTETSRNNADASVAHSAPDNGSNLPAEPKKLDEVVPVTLPLAETLPDESLSNVQACVDGAQPTEDLLEPSVDATASNVIEKPADVETQHIEYSASNTSCHLDATEAEAAVVSSTESSPPVEISNESLGSISEQQLQLPVNISAELNPVVCITEEIQTKSCASSESEDGLVNSTVPEPVEACQSLLTPLNDPLTIGASNESFSSSSAKTEISELGDSGDENVNHQPASEPGSNPIDLSNGSSPLRGVADNSESGTQSGGILPVKVACDLHEPVSSSTPESKFEKQEDILHPDIQGSLASVDPEFIPEQAVSPISVLPEVDVSETVASDDGSNTSQLPSSEPSENLTFSKVDSSLIQAVPANATFSLDETISSNPEQLASPGGINYTVEIASPRNNAQPEPADLVPANSTFSLDETTSVTNSEQLASPGSFHGTVEIASPGNNAQVEPADLVPANSTFSLDETTSVNSEKLASPSRSNGTMLISSSGNVEPTTTADLVEDAEVTTAFIGAKSMIIEKTELKECCTLDREVIDQASAPDSCNDLSVITALPEPEQVANVLDQTVDLSEPPTSAKLSDCALDLSESASRIPSRKDLDNASLLDAARSTNGTALLSGTVVAVSGTDSDLPNPDKTAANVTSSLDNTISTSAEPMIVLNGTVVDPNLVATSQPCLVLKNGALDATFATIASSEASTMNSAMCLDEAVPTHELDSTRLHYGNGTPIICEAVLTESEADRSNTEQAAANDTCSLDNTFTTSSNSAVQNSGSFGAALDAKIASPDATKLDVALSLNVDVPPAVELGPSSEQSVPSDPNENVRQPSFSSEELENEDAAVDMNASEVFNKRLNKLMAEGDEVLAVAVPSPEKLVPTSEKLSKAVTFEDCPPEVLEKYDISPKKPAPKKRFSLPSSSIPNGMNPTTNTLNATTVSFSTTGLNTVGPSPRGRQSLMNTSYTIAREPQASPRSSLMDFANAGPQMSQILATCSRQEHDLQSDAFSCIQEEAARFAEEFKNDQNEDNDEATIVPEKPGDSEREESFRPASDFDFDFLSRVGGKSKIAANLARKSLYVKFDPLVEKVLASSDDPESDLVSDFVARKQLIAEESKAEITLANDTQTEVTGDTMVDDRLIPITPLATKKTAAKKVSQTPSLRLEITRLQEMMLQQEAAHQEKEDLVEQLKRRVSELEAGRAEPAAPSSAELEEKDRKIFSLQKEILEAKNNNKQLVQVMEEYEKTISKLVAMKEEMTADYEREKAVIIAERDEALQHLANMEVAFNDVHQKYERAKVVIETFHANELSLKKNYDLLMDTVKKQKEGYFKFKQHAAETLQAANEEIQQKEREIARMKVVVKKDELRCKSLQETLAQKDKEIAELTEICDELIGKS